MYLMGSESLEAFTPGGHSLKFISVKMMDICDMWSCTNLIAPGSHLLLRVPPAYWELEEVMALVH